jgi:hypothetical protein
MSRWFLVLSIAAVPYLATAADSSASHRQLTEALGLLEQNKVTEAYSALEKIPMSAQEYPLAFAEMQKIHYRTSAWDKFFGFARFYRTQLSRDFFDPDLLLLEALALTKHCQFAPAQSVLKIARDWTTKRMTGAQAEMALQRVSAAEDLFLLQAKLKGNVNTEAKKSSLHAFSTTKLWRIPPREAGAVVHSAIKNPEMLRVYVRNSCDKGGV